MFSLWLFPVVADAVGYAAVFSLTTSALAEFGPERLGLRSNMNLMVLFGSGSIGSYVAGSLRTRFGSYLWPFACSTFAWVIACIASVGFIICRNRSRNVVARAK